MNVRVARTITRAHRPREDLVRERTASVTIPNLFVPKPLETHVVEPWATS